MTEYLLEAAMKEQNWEMAKGRLRAQVALSGANAVSSDPEAPELQRWQALSLAVEEFIKEVEGNGWHD